MTKVRHFLAIGLFLVFAPVAAMAASPAYKLQVDGLACPFCAYGVEKKLNGVDGVKAIEIDIKSGTVTVTMTDGATLDEAKAKTAVEAAGFALGAFEKLSSTVPGGSDQ
tara:strand:- start:2375 stop:2701 length:327 start_codon:yes stop_codon:yes gene_type:complete